MVINFGMAMPDDGGGFDSFVDPYYTQKVGNTGKTQAQLDAATNAQTTAQMTGGTVNPVTGMVQPKAATISGGTSSGTSSEDKPARKVVSTYTDPNTGDVYAIYDTGDREVISKGTIQQNAYQKAQADAAALKAQGQSAYDILYNQFNAMGLGSLVEPLKKLITSGASQAEMTMALRATPEYQRRFPANAARIQNGYAAIDEATYLAKEAAYQDVMRQYGLPQSYWKKDALGTNDAFTQLLSNDVKATELEDRVIQGKSLMDATGSTLEAIKQFYPYLTDGDVLAYVLDPKNAIKDIQRKVAVGQLGGQAIAQNLATSQQRAEELYNAGVTAQKYQAAAPFISEASTRGSQLASIYGMQYDQAVAEAEALGLTGAAKAAEIRKKITGREQGEFSGSSGVGGLGRDTSPYRQQTFGAGAY